MRNLTNNNSVPASIFNGAGIGVFLWACRLILAMLALLIVNVSSASAQTQLNLAKTICTGTASSSSGCTFAGTPKIGDPVYYEITVGNTYSATTPITLEEDFPAGFVPAYPIVCFDPVGNPITVTTTQSSPVLIQMDVQPSEDAVCRINGYFEVPGEVATNKVRGAGNTAAEREVTVVVDQDNVIPADLSIAKTASTAGPIDLTNGPQSVTYTITITTDNDVYLDDYLTIYDLLSLTPGSIPFNANLDLASVSCNVTSPGGSGLTCPVTNDFSGSFPNEAWTSFVSFGYGNALPILFRAGDVLTLSYTVEYSILAGQSCIGAIDANGINNRAFLGLANGSMSLTDLNSVNNDTVNSSLNTVDVYVDLPVIEDCFPPDPQPVLPSPLKVDKVYTEHITASGANSTSFPVAWDQQYVTYDITLSNTSSTEVVYDIDTYDRYSNQTYTPNHTVQLHSVDISSCPVSSVCAINQPSGWVSGMPAPQGPVQAINSYYDSAAIFNGSVDVLQPGESMTYTVKLILRDPTCDFAEFEQPKIVANSMLAPHKVDRIDTFSNLLIPFNFVVSGSATIEVAKTPPCDFNVKKTVLNAPNEVDFGVPMNYTIEFENGGEPIEAGTLLDVLRIEQNYYALGMDASYNFSCTENPSGSVVNFVQNGSGNGTVSYVQHPHQGLRVMDHPGFVSFAPYAKLTCNITVTVQQPASSDPYCFSNGTPTLGNAAIIDGSLFYNTNQGWPLSPQGTMWDAVSSELPKCYHLVVNKRVDPPTTTPNFGPNLTYTISVTNASGSGTSGDIDFPVTNPWTGPKFTDTFQNGPFPYTLPQNTPTFVSDNCTSSLPNACDWSWITPLSVTGHETGISKLPAGEILSYTYEIPPNYTPHEICNDISGELLIGGASADPTRWYPKDPATLGPKQACALIRTNLEITKTLDVHPTITLPPSASFVVDINCTPPTGFDPVAMSQTFTATDLVKTQKNLVVGSQCSIVEQTPDESLLPSHCDWNPPTYPDGTSFLADGSVEPHRLSVHNSMTCRFGDVRVSKSVEGNATELATGGLSNFDFELSCGTPSNETYTLNVPAAGSDIFLQIPDGSACTLTETPPTDYIDDEGRSCVWETPQYSGSGVTGNTATVSEGSVPHFIVKNKVHCTRLGSLEIRKLILATGSTPTIDPDIMFDATVSCNDLNANNVYSGTVSASINTPYTVTDIPTPATCTVIETTPSVSDLPAHCYAWGSPSYSPSGPVTLPDEAGSYGEIAMINRPICHTFGNIRVKKTLHPESAPLPAGTTFNYDMTCTDLDGVVTTDNYTISAGQTQSYSGYTTTNCTVTETLPQAPEYCSWESPQYSIPSANYTTHTGIEIVMRNKLVCPTDEIEVTKTFAEETSYIPDGQVYDIDVSCSNGQDYSLDVLAGGTVSTVSIPVGVTCEISETAPSDDLLPKGCSWDDPRIEPSTVTVIDGKTPDVTVENNITCENSLDVSKTFDIPSGVDFDTGFEFTVEVRCTPPNGPDTTHFVSLSQIDSLETVSGISLGSVCRIKEIMPTEKDGLPDHCRWSKPDYPDGDTIKIGHQGKDYGLSVHNSAICEYGEVKVIKNWANSLYTTGTPQPGPAGVLYDIDINCGSSFSDSVSLPVGGGHAFTDVPANTNCTISETLPTTHPGTAANKTCNFRNPSYSPSNPFSVSPNSGRIITVTNSDECKVLIPPLPKGYFDVQKTVIGGDLSLQNANYDVSITCGGVTRTVSATPGASNILGAFPPLMLSNQSCSVSETPDPALLPSNCTWNQPIYSVPPNFSPGFSTTGPYPIVQVMNSFTCTPIPGTLDIQKNLTVPPDFNQAIPPNYQVNVICLDVPIPPLNFSSSSAPIGVGLTTNVHSGSGQICMYQEPMPTTPLPDGCSWQTPTYPNGQLVFMASNQVATGTINNQVICGTGSLTVEKVLNPESDVAALGANFQVQLDCGGPMNTSNVYPLSAASSFTEGGIAGTQCTVTELTPPAIDPEFCYWAPPTYITSNSSSTNPATVALDASNPTVVIENNLICNRPPAILEITKSLVSETCFDPDTFTFNCDYEVTITNTGGQTANGPFTVYEDMSGVVGYTPAPSAVPSSWDCNVVSAVIPADPIECVSDTTVNIPPGGSTSFTVNMQGFSFYPPDENCVSVEDLNGGITEHCIDLESPELEIEKSLLTPDCAQTPVTECLFQITVTNVGSGDYEGLLLINEFAEPLSGWMTLPTEITTPPALPWECAPPNAVTTGPFTGHLCWELNANLPANGGTSSFTIGMDGNTFRQTDEPQNCASLLLYEPEQESCVEVPWSPGQFLWIEKSVVDCDSLANCTFEITIQNQASSDYVGPITIEDTVAPNGGTYVSNTGDFTCSGTGTVICNSNVDPFTNPDGDVTIPGNGTLSFDLTLDISGPITPEENCVTFESTYQQGDDANEFCVPIPEIPQLSIDKDKLTPGDCMMGSPLGDYQCEYSVTFTNEGPGDFNGPLSFDDTVSLNNPPLGPQPVAINSGPGAPWTCTADVSIPNLNCNTGSTNIFIADGDSVTITFILNHDGTRFDENCVTLEGPLQSPKPESCVRLNNLTIDKEKITLGDCMGMGPSPQLCEFKITVTNEGPFIFNDPFTISDVIDGGYGAPIDTWLDQALWNCNTVSGSVDCVYIGPPLVVGGSAELTLVLDMANPTFFEENCASITDPELFPIPEACVPLEANGLQISKTQVTPGACHGGGAVANLCTFEIVITNPGATDYNGDLIFTDQANYGTIMNTPPVNWGPQPDWNCVPSGTATECTQIGALIPAGGSTTLLLTVDMSDTPGFPYSENCVTLTTPASNEDCIPNGATAPEGEIEILKSYASTSTATPSGNFPINVSCAWPTNLPAWGRDYTTYGSPGSTSGNVQPIPDGAICTVTEQPILIDPGPGCQWLPPTYSPSQSVTISAGNRETVTVVNEIACNLPTEFLIEKDLISCATGPAMTNDCEYEITVTNTGSNSYTGPLSVDDNFTSVSNAYLISTNSVDGWDCLPQGSAQSFDCDTPSVTLAPNGQTSFTTVFSLAPGEDYDNCASLDNPFTGAVVQDCASVGEPPELEIVKTQLTQGDCATGTTPWACEFKIVISNVGGNDYIGPLSVTDALTGYPNSPILGFGDPAEWNCNSTVNGAVCDYIANSGIVTILSGGFVEFTITLDVQLPVPVLMSADENCASITGPALSPVPTYCIDLGPQPLLDIEKIKLSPHKCHEFPPGASTVVNDCEFQIVITNNGPGDFNGDITIDDEFGWGFPMSGSSTPISWTSTPSIPAWTCVSTPTGTACSANGVSIPENGSITIDITLDHHSYNGGWPVDNCASISEPTQSPMPEDCVPIVPTTVEKTLVPGQGDCWDPATGLFSCEFEFTITRDYMTNQTVPFDLTDSMPPLTNIDGNVTSGNWSCSPINGATELYCSQNSITGYVDVFTVLITGSSSSAPTENCATISEVTHTDVIAEVCVDLPTTPSSTGVEVFKELVGPCIDGICEFEITYINHGPNTLPGPIVVSDTFIAVGASNPIYLGTNSSDGWTCGYSSAYPLNLNCNLIGFPLSAGQSTSFTVDFDMSAGGDYENCAATWDALNSQAANYCETVSISQTGPTPDLQITKAIDPTVPCNPSGLCTFILTITNSSGTNFNGPYSFVDSFYQLGSLTSYPIAGNTSGWTCTQGSVGEIDCVSNTGLSVPAFSSETMTITLDLSGAFPMHTENCITQTTPSQMPPPVSCVAVGDAPFIHLQIAKLMAEDTDMPAPSGASFPMDVTCNGTLSNVSLGVDEVELLSIGHAGATCTVAEGAMPALSDPNCSWDAPVYSPSNTVTIPGGEAAAMTVTNRISCAPPLDAFIEVGKQYAPDSDWQPSNGAVHELEISCVNPAGTVVYEQTEDLNWTGFMGQIPSGTTCTFTENPDMSDLPQGCSWEQPYYSNGGVDTIAPGGGSVFYIENKAVCQNVNTTDFTIEKTFLNGGSCVNSSSGLCEFQIVITNNGSDYTGDIDFDDLVSAGGYGGAGGIGATLANYNSSDPWNCGQSGQSVNCGVSPITLQQGQSTIINVTLDIPPGSPNIKNCVQLDYPVQDPLPTDCVQNIDPQARVQDPNGTTGITWYLGPETALPIDGTFVTGGMINDQPFTSSDDVSFGDVYDPAIGFRFGAELPVNDNWSLVGGLGYNRFIGNRVSLGTIAEPGPAGLVNSQSLTGVMSDLEQYSIDAGVHYNIPGFKLSDGTNMLPYIEGRLGAAYIPEIAFEDARLGQQVFNGGVIPMYKDSWVPKADVRLGVDIPLEKDFTLGVETGLQYSGALRSDNTYFGPGVPLAGTNNNSERWSVPLHVRFGAKF